MAGILGGKRSARAEADSILAMLFGVTAIAMTAAMIPMFVPALTARFVVVMLPLALVFGPLTYAYAKTMLGGVTPSTNPLARDVTPWFATGFALSLPFATAAPPDFLQDASALWAVLLGLVFLLIIVVNSGYILYSLVLVFRRSHHQIDVADLRLVRAVVSLAAIALAAGFLVELPQVFGASAPLDPVYAAAIDLFCVMAVGGLALLHKPKRLNDRPRYARSVMTQNQAARLERKLRHAMEIQSLYKDPQLSLSRLAAHLGCPPHRLTHLLATRIGCSYSDYVSRWRVEAACKLLRKTDETVLQILLAVGFNTRSTFNATFLRHTGQSPSSYRDPTNAVRTSTKK
ncbi:helix-turn-helix domain-containing protein [Tateyamaria omphalii]|uniref:helix-turn-helix domain-containing protein n=1 Tax=Tateyamaria omphalii TaxID=299262 RepID=UPI0015610F56|nr:helix-turn-helix transcriptional regulator [Tateyamaria omphalii]